jgi:hypothetical protein
MSGLVTIGSCVADPELGQNAAHDILRWSARPSVDPEVDVHFTQQRRFYFQTQSFRTMHKLAAWRYAGRLDLFRIHIVSGTKHCG